VQSDVIRQGFCEGKGAVFAKAKLEVVAVGTLEFIITRSKRIHTGMDGLFLDIYRFKSSYA
jgi:mannose-6-phosphate isomerase class I